MNSSIELTDSISHDPVKTTEEWRHMLSDYRRSDNTISITKTLILRQKNIKNEYYMIVSDVRKKKINWKELCHSLGITYRNLLFASKEEMSTISSVFQYKSFICR
jgi:hypothetical protein